MADALVFAVMEQLTSIIRREVEKEVKLVVGVRQEIGKLSSALTMLQAVLDDAEEKQVKEKAVKLWLEKLKDVVYDADDVLDEWNTRTIISQIHGVDDDAVNGGIRNKVLSYLFSPCFRFKDVGFRHDIGIKIKQVRERLNVIAEEKNQYNLIARQSSVRPRQLTSSVIDVSKVYGRDHDKVVIMGMLFGESSRQVMPVHVISIVGTGGFGKTTLAKLILKEVKVTTAFDKTMWVCVSEPFDRVRVAKEIIEQTGKEVRNVIAWEVLHNLLCESLKGKKFFLVLDDVWTDDTNEWEPFEHALNGGASGSRVLITTRNEKHMIGSTQNYKLGVLSKDDSWMLFKVIAFQGREEDLNKLEGIGRQIAEKCKGVPLSIKSIASLMRFKKTKKDWSDVLTSETWNIQNVEKDILPSLFLSYYPLPSNLKQCFIYCAIFPKDIKLAKNWLVKLWMAQGFFGSEGSKDLEKIGEEYFDDLAMCSFFQDFDRDSDGNIIRCKMHDLVHDFAQFLAKSECCIMEANYTKFDESKVRHLAATVDFKYSSIYTAKKLRTFLTPARLARRTAPMIELYRQLACLRALDLGGYGDIVELSDEVGRLLHLRYLNLSGTSLSELPESLCNLYNLQSLLLNWCEKLQKLPGSIGKLSNLRHLEIERTFALEYLPRGIGRLGFLRTLSKFIVDRGSKGCKIGELKHLNFLRGDLEIEGLERVGDMNEAAEAELEKKKDLHRLDLIFGEDTNESDAEKMEGVLKNLQPHDNLEELAIEWYPGLHFPDWIARLSNLVNLKLSYCKNLRVLPDLSKLKSLETLYLWDLDNLEECEEIVPSNNQGEGDIQLPCLREVIIRNCPKLKVVPHYMFSHTLKNLEMNDCPELGEVQPCLPPLLEYLHLESDVGVFSKSLPLVGKCSHNSSYPNLNRLIWSSPHSSLPKGFNRLTSIQSLGLYRCETLDFELEELKHLTMLQELTIYNCPILKERFGEGKDWRSTLSHVPKMQYH